MANEEIKPVFIVGPNRSGRPRVVSLGGPPSQKTLQTAPEGLIEDKTILSQSSSWRWLLRVYRFVKPTVFITGGVTYGVTAALKLLSAEEKIMTTMSEFLGFTLEGAVAIAAMAYGIYSAVDTIRQETRLQKGESAAEGLKTVNKTLQDETARLTTLNQQVAQVVAVEHKLSETVQHEEQELTALNQQVAQVVADEGELKKTIQHEEQELTALNQQVAQVVAVERQLAETMQHEEAELTALNQQVAQVVAIEGELKKQEDQLEARETTAEQEIATLKKQMEMVTKEIPQLKHRIAGLEAQMEEMKKK